MAIDDNTSYELTGYQVKDLAQKIRAKADSNSLASVATSGLYSDLTGAPTIPTVYNGTLTIQQNGTTLGTFSANQDTNETINITSGSSSSITHFYGSWSTAKINSYSLYKEPERTHTATGQEIYDAYCAGDVLIHFAYTSAPSDYTKQAKLIFCKYNSIACSLKTAFDDPNNVTVTSISYSTQGTTGTFYPPVAAQQKLTAGANIVISGSNEISATDTTYSAGTGISIDANNVISTTGGGGSAITFFYADPTQTGTTRSLYKDDTLTTAATMQDILDASEDGVVIMRTDSSDQYGQAYIDASLQNVYFLESEDYTVMFLGEGKAYHFNTSYPAATTFSYWETEYQKKLTAGTNVTITGDTISATDTTYSDFTGATSSTAGANGLVPAPAAGDEGKVLHGDGTWKDTTAKLVEMSYGESNAWAKFIAAYNAGSIVYCRASSNANPGTGSQTRKAFMAYVNNAANPTNVEFQYVRSQSSKTDSQQCDQVFVYTLTNANGGTWSVASRNMGPKIVAGTGMSSTFTTGANATITLNAEPNYSTSEVDTKVKWVNGKTIYRKTINFGALPDSTVKNVAHNISNIEHVIKIEGIAESTNSTWIAMPLVYKSSDSAYNTELSVSATDVICNTTQDRSMFTAYVTLYYTKSS